MLVKLMIELPYGEKTMTIR